MEADNYEYFSRHLFLYLCHLIGSEKTVHSRRVCFQVMDDIFSHRNFEIMISSGSKAEGLNMAGSDIDIMSVLKILPVFHHKSEINSPIGFITDFDHTPPGFVLLKGVSGHNDPTFFTLSEYGPVLSNEKFKTFFSNCGQRPHENLLKIHGPCITTKSTDLDCAYCLRSQAWHKVAGRWLTRPRYTRWPQSNVVATLAEEGLLYVPIGSKYGAKEGNPLQWRLSFSVQEKLLIYSFNHTQLLCYALLKLILKEIINAQPHVSNLLCSYFMKTTVFWMSEEIELSEWRPEGLFSCFKSCIQRLIYWVQLGYCPNYFIPENNMFEGKIHGKKQKNLLSVLKNLDARDIHFTLLLPTLSHFNPRNYKQSEIRLNEIDLGVYPFLSMYLMFVSMEISPRLYLPLLLTKIRRYRQSRLRKYLYYQWMAHLSIQMLIEMPYKWYCSNKRFYQQYKQSRVYALIGTNIDTVSGWLWFSTFLYQHKDYRNALAVTSTILPECTPDKIFITDEVSDKIADDMLSLKNLNFLKRHKINCIYQLYKIPRINSLFYNSELSFCQIEQGILAPPVIYMHFLRCMCFHHLRNISQRNNCLRDMEMTIEEDFFIGSCELRMSSYVYLLKALQITGDYSKMADVEKKLQHEFLQLPYLGDILPSCYLQ